MDTYDRGKHKEPNVGLIHTCNLYASFDVFTITFSLPSSLMVDIFFQLFLYNRNLKDVNTS